MELVCRKCESSNIIEKHNIPVHKIGVYCGDCEAWINWGSIKGNELITEGRHVAKIISAEEIQDIFILLKLETKEGLIVRHKIWKSRETKKYNPIFLNAMLNGFCKTARDFKSISDLFEYIQGKNVVISIEHTYQKGKAQPLITKWEKSVNLDW